jgi:hypothetical protein
MGKMHDGFMYELVIYLIIENLPNINKTKHPKKGEKKLQDGRTQVHAKRKNHKQGQTTRGT